MIQIDMSMPNVCDDCPFMDEDHGDYPYCIALGQNRGYTFRIREKRFPNCPLKPAEEQKKDTETDSLLKKQDAVVKQWTKEIADNQLAHAPNDSHEFMSLNEHQHLENEYKRGIWDGLQIAWNIISEGR